MLPPALSCASDTSKNRSESNVYRSKKSVFLVSYTHLDVYKSQEDELRQVAAIIEKYNLWVVSDEIHCDLIRCGRRHIPMAKVMDSYPKLITCMAPTKTFNMAGLAFSNIIIRDPALRAHFQERDKLFGMVNPMSLTAAQAAYAHGGAWHEALKQYLDENFAFVKAFLARELPEAVMYIPEATYLAWVDLSRCLPDCLLYTSIIFGVALFCSAIWGRNMYFTTVHLPICSFSMMQRTPPLRCYDVCWR